MRTRTRYAGQPHGRTGLGWARAVLAMAPHLQDLSLAGVVQLTGALTGPDVDVSATELVRDIARRTRAEPSVFYAPMIVSDPAAAGALTRQQELVDAFARFARVTKAIVGIGGWDPPASTLHDALNLRERALMRRQGVRADPDYRAIPILVLTTESSPEKKMRARDAGATGWIVKPFDHLKLIAAIRRVAA